MWGWDEDQCWTLARIAEVVRRRFGVEYTLAGLDLLGRLIPLGRLAGRNLHASADPVQQGPGGLA